MTVKSQADRQHEQQADHIFHVWINHRQDERVKAGEEHEHDLYEFKSMLQFLEYGHRTIEQAFTGALPLKHQQCSHQPVETLPSNRLLCALGQDVTTCPILTSLKATFDVERDREIGQMGKRYASVPDALVYQKMATVCAWHIYTEQLKHKRFIDTSEGWLTDESDRIFWQRTYASLAAGDSDDDGATA